MTGNMGHLLGHHKDIHQTNQACHLATAWAAWQLLDLHMIEGMPLTPHQIRQRSDDLLHVVQRLMRHCCDKHTV